MKMTWIANAFSSVSTLLTVAESLIVIFFGIYLIKRNSHAVMSLAEGMKAEDVIRRTQNITCHGGNSCPKELSKAIRKCIEEVKQQLEQEQNA